MAINTKSDNNGYDSLDVTGNISNTDNTDKDTLEYIKYSIDNKLVYIKLKIKGNTAKKILCLSFHYARHNMNFPYK